MTKVGVGAGAAIVAGPALAKGTSPMLERAAPPSVEIPPVPAGFMESAEESWTKFANKTIGEMASVVHDPALLSNKDKFWNEVGKVMEHFFDAYADATSSGRRTRATEAYATHFLILMKPEPRVMEVFQHVWEVVSRQDIEESFARPPQERSVPYFNVENPEA